MLFGKNRDKVTSRFVKSLIFGMVLFSTLGIVGVSIIANTFIGNVVYRNLIALAQKQQTLYAYELDNWFSSTAQRINDLSVFLRGLNSRGCVESVAALFTAESEIIENVFIGFTDGSLIEGTGWDAPQGWSLAERPWYIAAVEAGAGNMIMTEPHLSYASGNIVITVAVYLPDLLGAGAVLGTPIPINTIVDRIVRHPVAEGGYLLLVSNDFADSKIIVHPYMGYNPDAYGEMTQLIDVPNGEFFQEHVFNPTAIRFLDHRKGPAYLVTTPLNALDWTILAIVPTDATDTAVAQYMKLIIFILTGFVLVLFFAAFVIIMRMSRGLGDLRESEDRLKLILDHMPIVTNFRDRDFNMAECNAYAPKLFGLRDKQEYNERFNELTPEFQPDGQNSDEKAKALITQAFETGEVQFEWMHQKPNGEPIPCDITLTRVPFRGKEHLLASVYDLRDRHKIEEANKLMASKLQIMLDTSPMVCSVVNREFKVIEVNRKVEDLLKIPSKQLYIDNFFDYCPERQLCGTSSREKADIVFTKVFETGHGKEEWLYKSFDGEIIPTEEIYERVTIGDEDFVIVYTRDLRDFYKYKETERIAKERLKVMLESSPLACIVLDENLKVIEINTEMEKLVGAPSKQYFYDNFSQFLSEYQPDRSLTVNKMSEIRDILLTEGSFAPVEWTARGFNGEELLLEIQAVSTTLEGRKILIAHFRDLRDIKRATAIAKKLESLAYSDALTGLSNRRRFEELAGKTLSECVVNSKDFSLILFDIDHFKSVNDTYGHPVGDEVLKIVSLRTKNVVKEDTLVARIGGEEFVIMITANRDYARKTALRVKNHIAATAFYINKDCSINITSSFGVASKDDANALKDILNNADQALYQAKKSGRNAVVCYPF